MRNIKKDLNHKKERPIPDPPRIRGGALKKKYIYPFQGKQR